MVMLACRQTSVLVASMGSQEGSSIWHRYVVPMLVLFLITAWRPRVLVVDGEPAKPPAEFPAALEGHETGGEKKKIQTETRDPGRRGVCLIDTVRRCCAVRVRVCSWCCFNRRMRRGRLGCAWARPFNRRGRGLLWMGLLSVNWGQGNTANSRLPWVDSS